MRNIDYMETHIVNVCNLRCKGCSHFSPFVSPKDAAVDYSAFEMDIKRLSQLFDHIFTLRLLGGEPFLCRELLSFCRCARKWLPESDIRLVSNGLLIPRVPADILTELAVLRIGVDVSNYPETKQHIDEIRARLERFGVSHRLSEEIRMFHKRLNLRGDSDIEEIFEHCPTKHCAFFMNGMLANCSAPMLARYINKRFGTGIDVGDDLLSLHHPGLTADDVLSFLSRPMEACRYCALPEEFPWTNTQEPRLEDWLVSSPSGRH